ncbi:Sua5 family C-terminal domain-containing protein, partial [Amaricoccus sp.]|uniref:Sua5 family C-terminal domain-containing protein n=1 Tax=Amaricoccus sp. TaxID=1872485 RepID=UPI002616572A
GLESTIVGFADGAPVLLRPGGLPAEAVAEALGRPLGTPGAGISAPGQLASHYAPRVAVRLDADAPEPGELWLGFGPSDDRPGLNLSPAGDLAEAARTLFAHLRALDAMAERTGATGIAVARLPRSGLGLALNDRLARAAAPRAG